MSDPIFQTSLQDMIKGIRSHKKDPSSYISKEIADIKSELRSTDPFLKAEAVRKLTYLQMIGYNVSWAAFAIVEVMSQPKFGHKRIGYLAANQSFDENTEVILLTTNLFKKEFSGGALNSTQYEMGLALNSLANIATKDLARDCISDLVLLMNHQKPYIRKKAVLCMYKLYVKYPQGLRLTFDKLKERLDDHESSVVSTAVNVICELANKNPRNYLAMAPKFFKLLTTSSNNWMLIKVVKLLGALVSEEPRLARKLLEPLATIIQNTGAKSLQYECIYTVTEALPYSKREDGTEAKNAPAVIKLCSDYLRGFIEDADQNLKYLGLVGLVQLMKSNARSVVEHLEIVLHCLDDDDVTIRSKALELLAGIVSRKSLVGLVVHLMKHARQAEGAYRDDVISKILFMCKKEKYSLVSDFSWYTSILLELAVLPGARHGAEVADQLIEVALRVDTVRPYAVETMLSMLLNDQLVLGHARTTVSEVLKAAAWIVGEYSDIITRISRDRSASVDGDDVSDDGEEGVYWIEGATGEDIRSKWRGQAVHLMVMEALLHPRTTNLPTLVQKVYLQAAMKIFIRASCDCELKEVADIVGVLRCRLPLFMQHLDLEVQERATTFRHLLAELDVLAMNWEDSTEEISRETPGAAAVGVTGSGNGSGLNDKEKQMMDLLEMPMYTQSSVRAVDEYGAKIAIDKHAILKAVTAEEFYAVHSKAQRRVPVPADISLDRALNEKALDKLLSVEIPEDLNLNALTLVQVAAQAPNAYSSGARLTSAQGSGGYFEGIGRSQYDDVGMSEHMAGGGTTSSSVAWEPSGTSTGYSSRQADDVFMLSSGAKNNADIIPLSKILGDNFEDTAPAGSKSRSGKSQKKGKSKRRSAEVNTVEMVPAGAVDSSDDEQHQPARGSSSRASKGADGGKRRKAQLDEDDEDMDLGGVDITTPLRHDEVIHVQTHRVVPSYPSEHTGAADAEAGIAATWHTAGEDEGRSKKHKKHGKDKDRGEKDKGKKDKSKDKKSSKDKAASSNSTHKNKSSEDSSLLLIEDTDLGQTASTGSQAVENLLGIDLNAPVNTAPSSGAPMQFSMPAQATSASDRIAAMFDSAEAQKRQQSEERVAADRASRSAQVESSSSRPHRESKEGRDGKDGKSKDKKSSGSGHFYLPAYSDDQLDVLYALTCEDRGRGSSYPVHVRWKVVNHSSDGSAVSVGVMLQSPLLNVNPCAGSFVSLATNLASNADVTTTTELGLYNPVEEAISIPCRLTLSVESLIGPEVRSVVSEVRITICSTFSPSKLSEEGFAQALSKFSPAKWGSATAQVAVSGKPKSAFKALGGFLRAHIVESEYSKAASMAARTQSGGSVYVLAKVGSGGKSAVQLDIKCACSTKQESDRVAQLVAEALNACSL